MLLIRSLKNNPVPVQLRQIISATFSSEVQSSPEKFQKRASFLPPGPPSFMSSPAIKAEADRIYSRLIKDFMSPSTLPADPWDRREAWRRHPYFGPINVIKHAFPGFSWALIAFIGYLGYEQFVETKEKH